MSKTLKQIAYEIVKSWEDLDCEFEGLMVILSEATDNCQPACISLDYEQIEQEFFKEEGVADTRIDSSLNSFTEGVRFAERMHGITEVK